MAPPARELEPGAPDRAAPRIAAARAAARAEPVPAVDDADDAPRAPLRRRIPADLETPVSAFLKLRPCGAVFLLESVERGVQVGRYSFIGLSPYATISLAGDEVVRTTAGGPALMSRADPADPFAPIRAELRRGDLPAGAGLPGPFGGAVGYIGYDVARRFERLPGAPPDRLGLPDYRFLFPGAMAVFDHVRSEIEILVLPPAGEAPAAGSAAEAELARLLDALEAPLPRRGRPAPTPLVEPQFNLTRREFTDRVETAKRHIMAGDAFQIVLSQRLEGRTAAPPFQVYRALRALNPSPYLFYLDLGDFQLVGSSPEMLVKLEGRRASLCPIAGTRPRGETPAQDQELEAELMGSEKERAEHVMLVDLGRNDLGRVCEPGTVRPESLLQVEKYSHVMHIVSRLEGLLRPELDMFDLVRAVFPAGTTTGAPKIRAMQIIDELEPEARGPYAGAVGWFGRQGHMDLCIAIRTLVMQGDRYLAQAGAGIVADSSPEAEYHETLDKIRALRRAVAIAEQGL